MRVLIACGGTAGHIFPGLALAEELKKEDGNCQIVIVISTHARDKRFIESSGIFKDMQMEAVSCVPLPYRLSFRYIPFGLRLTRAFIQSFFIMRRYKPDGVIGFGGYASFAPLIIAHFMGISTLIHEQNVIPGRANQMLARIADKVAITFDDTRNFFSQKKLQRKIVKTGLPLRKYVLDQRKTSPGTLRLSPGKFTVLILGGSQGAHGINELVLNCLNQMSRENREHLQLIHLAGRKDCQHVRMKYESLGVASYVFEFLEDMADAYSHADVLIGRSGASTIFEAATFGLPCVLIPHTCGTGHQKENAAFLERNGAALVLDERSASAQDLGKMLLELINDRGLRESLSHKIRSFKITQASRILKNEIYLLCRGQ